MGAELFHADGRAGRHNEANSPRFAILRKCLINNIRNVYTALPKMLLICKYIWFIFYLRFKDCNSFCI